MIATEKKIILGVIMSTIALIIGAVALFAFQSNQEKRTFTREELMPSARQHILGNASASAYLVEFSDFQCPACAAYAPVVKQLVETHKEKIAFMYRHFPLPQHTFAEQAAMAAEAAGKQGKFWDMHDALFANANNLSENKINEFAKQLSLNEEQFNKEKNNQEIQAIIEEDKKDGRSFGITSTPTFFLNGKKLKVTSPNQLIQEVTRAINGE